MISGNGSLLPELDSRQDVVLLGGAQNQTHTLIRFKRPWDTCDEEQVIIFLDIVWKKINHYTIPGHGFGRRHDPVDLGVASHGSGDQWRPALSRSRAARHKVRLPQGETAPENQTENEHRSQGQANVHYFLVMVEKEA